MTTHSCNGNCPKRTAKLQKTSTLNITHLNPSKYFLPHVIGLNTSQDEAKSDIPSFKTLQFKSTC